MSEIEKKTVPAVDPAAKPGAELGAEPNVDPELGQALAHFRANAHAWSAHVLSQAAYDRPRQLSAAAHGSWRPALGWALGCVLVAGGLSGGLYEHHHRQVMAQLAEQAREAREQQLAAQQLSADEDLLATVDSDVSRDVPAAMEPLEHLMDEDSGQSAGQ
jgi:hypothetical protein